MAYQEMFLKEKGLRKLNSLSWIGIMKYQGRVSRIASVTEALVWRENDPILVHNGSILLIGDRAIVVLHNRASHVGASAAAIGGCYGIMTSPRRPVI